MIRTRSSLLVLCLMLLAALATVATMGDARRSQLRKTLGSAAGVRRGASPAGSAAPHNARQHQPVRYLKKRRNDVTVSSLSDASSSEIDLARAFNLLKACTAPTLSFELSGYRHIRGMTMDVVGYSTLDIGPLKEFKLSDVSSVRQLLHAAGYAEVIPPAFTQDFLRGTVHTFFPLNIKSAGLYKKM